MKKLLETLTALAPFLAPYPAWAKTLVMMWAVLTAIVLVTLVLARPIDDTQKLSTAIEKKATNPLGGTSVTVGKGDVSIESVGGDKVGRDKIVGDKIERQVIISEKSYDQSVVIESFSIDADKCGYEQYDFDPNKPFWPVAWNTYVALPGGKCETDGKVFNSNKEAYDYDRQMRKIYNHPSFSKDCDFKVTFERLADSKPENKSNYPVFYVSVSNHKSKHVVLSRIDAVVFSATPLVSIGESQSLIALATYDVEISPSEGTYSSRMIPNLKVEGGDAAAFRVVLKPQVERVGGYSWLMVLRFFYSENEYLETVPFSIIM